MNFNLNPAIVRGEMFKNDGNKWAYTIAIDMAGVFNFQGPAQGVAKALLDGRFEGVKEGAILRDETEDPYLIVVFDPYHKNAFPVTVRSGKTNLERILW